MDRPKEDIALAATASRSYNRHWRAKRLSWGAIGKIRYLIDGAVDYMDPVTLCYPRTSFNRLRKALGFKQDSELTELVEQADAFRIVRDRQTHEMVAFMTPLVPDRFVPSPSQEIEEPKIESGVFYCKANALANPNDRDKISENLRIHKNSINMKMLLAGNVPKFHATPNDEALQRIEDGLLTIINDPALRQSYFGEFLYHYQRKYKVGEFEAYEALGIFAMSHLKLHMARRVGIENWPRDAIGKWLRNYFGPKKLEYVITEAKEAWRKYKEEEQAEESRY